jgi:hypothetical protein
LSPMTQSESDEPRPAREVSDVLVGA